MKLILLSLLLIAASSSFAQEREPAIKNGTATISLTIGAPNFRKIEKFYNPYASYGPINLTADYQLHKRFAICAQYSYASSAAKQQTIITSDSYRSNGTSRTIVKKGGKFLYEQRSAYHTLTAGGQYCYLNKGRIWMACSLSFGVEIPKHAELYMLDSNNVDHSSDLFVVKNPHFIAGVRFADVKFNVAGNFGLRASLGYGLDGIVTAGVLYKITGRE